MDSRGVWSSRLSGFGAPRVPARSVMQYPGRPHGGEGRGPSDEDGPLAWNISEDSLQWRAIQSAIEDYVCMKLKLKRLLCIHNITRFGGVLSTISILLRSSIVRMLM